ncbi:MAG: hypothetical protein JWM68_5349 [Verrucomicrobiales bacterium]|nr:hypothetical protein [Verrucomicrobiales bacterium]
MPAYLGDVKGFWNFRLLLIVCAMSVAMAANAVLRPVEHRYLFILETSKEMKREAEPARNVLLQLLYSGVMGQMHAGDTFGIWTYNDKLQASYPMQSFVWEDREALTTRAAEYLKAQKFTGGAHLENALLPLLKLATNSPNLTVILISDGKQAVAGTPFDQEIRSLHKKYYDDLQESKLPFVTVLVAYHGEFINYAVNSALGPIRVPRLPKPPAVTNIVEAPTPAPPVKRGESLILRGPLPKNKTETTVPPVPPVTTPTESANVTTASVTPPVAGAIPPAPPTVPSAPVITTNDVTAPIAAAAPVVTAEPAAVIPKPEVPVVQPVTKAEETTPVQKEQASNVATFTVQPTNETASIAPATPPLPKPPQNPTVEKTTVVTEPAMLAQTEGSSSLRKVLVVIGILLFLILLVLVLMLRKSKHSQRSLITQSIDKSVP